MFFSVSNEPPIYYYPKAAEVQGIRVWADTNYLRVSLPALLPDKRSETAANFFCYRFRLHWCKVSRFHTFPIA